MYHLLGPKVPIEQSFFRVPRFAARIVGFWPQTLIESRSWLALLHLYLGTFAVAVGGITEPIYGFVHLDENISSALEGFCPGATKFICLLKMIILTMRRKQIARIVSSLNLLIMQDTRLAKRGIIQPLASFGSVISSVLLLAGTMTEIFFSILPLIKMSYHYFNEMEVELLMPYNAYLPNVFVNFPYYPASYLMLVISGEAAVLTFTAVDGFFACSCLYLCALFRMLQNDIRDAFAELQEQEQEQFSLAQNILIQQRLVVLIERHNTIIDLCSDFTSEFSLIILMHFLSAALVLCLSILNMLLNSASWGILTYICYSIAALTQLYLYCSGGTYVSESSSDIATVIYDIDWYKCDVRTRRILLMMLQRAQKAKTISVPFFTPSLPVLRSIISTAGSYFALLKTFI